MKEISINRSNVRSPQWIEWDEESPVRSDQSQRLSPPEGGTKHLTNSTRLCSKGGFPHRLMTESRLLFGESGRGSRFGVG